MNRLDACFKQSKKQLIAYIVAGYPKPEQTVAQMHALVKGGANIIELGVPFSDPSAEGPVIASAHFKALGYNVDLPCIFELVRQFREKDQQTPIVLMGYNNPYLAYGYKRLAQDCQHCGVDAILNVDSSITELATMQLALNNYGIKTVVIIAPTTTEQRIKVLQQIANSFIYYVSLKGVTGAGHLDTQNVKQKLNTIKKIIQLPIVVGFGISNSAQVTELNQYADGVVIGTHLIKAIEQQPDNPQVLTETVANLKR